MKTNEILFNEKFNLGIIFKSDIYYFRLVDKILSFAEKKIIDVVINPKAKNWKITFTGEQKVKGKIHRDRKDVLVLFKWKQLLINPVSLELNITKDEKFDNKTICLKFKTEDEYYFYWWILKTDFIKSFLIPLMSHRKLLWYNRHDDILVEDIENLPIVKFDSNNIFHKEIVKLSKKIFENKNKKQEDININELENKLNELVYYLYGIIFDFERYLIEDFIKNQKDWDKTIDEKDLEDYKKVYIEEFTKSMLWDLMKNNKMLNNSFNLYSQKTWWWIRYVAIDFTWKWIDIDDAKIKNNIKNYMIEKLFSEKDKGLWFIRYYDEKNNVLYYFKPNLKKYWRKSEAVKDVLMENEIVLWKNKWFLNFKVDFRYKE